MSYRSTCWFVLEAEMHRPITKSKAKPRLLNVKKTPLYKALTIKTNFIGCTNNVREEATLNKGKWFNQPISNKSKYLPCSKGVQCLYSYTYNM